MVPAGGLAPKSMKSASVFISGLPEGICEADIIRAFRRFGTVEALHFNVGRNCAIVDLHDEYASRCVVSTYPFIARVSSRSNQPCRLKVGFSSVGATEQNARSSRVAHPFSHCALLPSRNSCPTAIPAACPRHCAIRCICHRLNHFTIRCN